MNFEYRHLLPVNFDSGSKVWVYQGSRLFTLGEALQVEEIMEDFVNSWSAHSAKVKGYANLFFGQFIVLMADEMQAGVSGCSIDSSVRMIKAIEATCKVALFNRQNLAFIIKDKVELLPLQQLQYAFENNFINADTIYFNNLVQTKNELEQQWMVPVKNSWLVKKLKNITVA